MESILNQILTDTQAVPFAEINGRKVYSFADAQKVNQRRLAEEKVTGRADLSVADMQSDIQALSEKSDRIAESSQESPAVQQVSGASEDQIRISEKENGKPQLEVVLDKRAIKGQQTNKVYSTSVNVYILSPNGRGGKGLAVTGETIVNNVEFVNEFKKSIPVYKEGGINKQVVDVFNAVGRYTSKEQNSDDLEKIFG